MTRLRRVGLKLDDPLSPAGPGEQTTPVARQREQEQAAGPADAPAGSTASPRQQQLAAARARPSQSVRSALGTAAIRKAPPQAATSVKTTSAWRVWSWQTRVASYRLPDELLAELASTAAELQLPVGLLVTAAITRLLDEPSAAIAALVDRADDARIEGRRAARRRVATAPRGPEAASGRASTL
jgi:hypothetical protein